jgi:hypothetical protein
MGLKKLIVAGSKFIYPNLDRYIEKYGVDIKEGDIT